MKRQLQYDSKRQWIVSFWWFVAAVGALVLVMNLSGCDAMNPAQAKIEQYKRDDILRHVKNLGSHSVNAWVTYSFFILRADEKLAVLAALDERYTPQFGVDLYSSAGCDRTLKEWRPSTGGEIVLRKGNVYSTDVGCGAMIGSYKRSKITGKARFTYSALADMPAIKKNLEKEWRAHVDAIMADFKKKEREAEKKKAAERRRSSRK